MTKAMHEEKHVFAVERPPEYFAEGKYYLLKVEELVPTESGEIVGDAQTGLMALYEVCPHLFCSISFDAETERFVCPCHDSQFDRAGNRLQGPAKRNMDQFRVSVNNKNEVTVDTSKFFKSK